MADIVAFSGREVLELIKNGYTPVYETPISKGIEYIKLEFCQIYTSEGQKGIPSIRFYPRLNFCMDVSSLDSIYKNKNRLLHMIDIASARAPLYYTIMFDNYKKPKCAIPNRASFDSIKGEKPINWMRVVHEDKTVYLKG